MTATHSPSDSKDDQAVSAGQRLSRRPSTDPHRLPATPVANPRRTRLIDLSGNLGEAVSA